MARPTISGWKISDPSKPNEYSSQFLSGNSRYSNVTDVSNGQRSLYSVGADGNKTLISTTDANGQVTKGPGYDAVSSQYSSLDAANKKQSQFAIQNTSTTEEKAAISKTSEYKSNTGNAIKTGIGTSGGAGIGTGPRIIGVTTFRPDYINPIIPIGKIVKYPENMNSNQDRIMFTAVEIKPRTDYFDQGAANVGGLGANVSSSLEEFESSFSAFKIQDPQYIRIAGSVVLPIQSGIQDQNSVSWSQDSINAIDALLYNAATALITQSDSPQPQPDINKALSGAGGAVKAAAQSNVGRLQRYFAGQAAGVNNIVARTDGVVLNPNLELIFQGPQLRPFSFTFKMSARSEKEGENIKLIIKYFKRHMAVRREKGIFLKAPHVFTILYFQGEKKIHPSIGKISQDVLKKACALTNMTVDYTPLGSYMTYNDPDTTMVSYTISLQFQEIQPIYDTDYLESHKIGY